MQELNGATPPAATANLLTGLNIDEYFTRTASSTTSTLLADALGSTIGLVGSGGTIATNYTYQPFGAVTTGGAANANSYQFTGRENDGTGLYFSRARYYSPTFQRSVTQFVYDRLNPVQELNSSGGVTANLLTGLNLDEFFTRTASSTTSTLLADALGSTIGLVTAANGPIASSYTYQPFGSTSTGGTGNTNPYQFTGRENDATGLYFYRARYYSPTFQRFIAQDPIGFRGGDPNLYAFVGDEPLNKKDPKGTGATAVGAVFVGCSIYNLYETASLFSQSALLQEQIIKIQRQIDELKKRECPANVDPTEYDLRLGKVTNDLQNDIFRLTQQFAIANGSNVAQGLTTEVGCLAASGAAVFVPEP